VTATDAAAAANPFASGRPDALGRADYQSHFACQSRHGLTSHAKRCSSALNDSYMNDVSKKIYWMASSARFSFWESTAASLLATSWSTALTTGVPAACRFRPTAVTSARTALRSDGSSVRFTSPSVSRRSTNWVTLDRTQTSFAAAR